ncbi:MAG TPA: diiron oxygenase [Streptosporangiaceae bacterium]|nr:diiron oxygenase [Streptosporangiaceae bacterium]
MESTEDSLSPYVSKFTNWERRASVRAKPRRLMGAAGEKAALFFPPELVPVVQHPLVSSLGEETVRRLLLQRLHIYLDFTAELEQLAVNPVTQRISRRKTGIDLPGEMVADAYKICTDESWHAQFTDDLQRQLAQVTGVGTPCHGQPYFLRRLDELTDAAPPGFRGLCPLFFTIVSETLISSILSHIPRDQRIMPAVRQVVADHAEDEGRHHTYFVKVFEYTWEQLSPQYRQLAGPLLAEFIVAFLKPDYAALTAMLATHRLTADEIQGVIEESHPKSQEQREMRVAAHATLRLLDRHGVFDDTSTYEAFAAHGLLEG